MLEIKDLCVSYGAIDAVKGISLKVNDGEIVSGRSQRRRQDHHPAHHHRSGAGQIRQHYL